MTVQDCPGQTLFASDAPSLLQALLMTPVASHKSRPDRAEVGCHTLRAFSVDETQTLLQTLLEASVGSQVTRLSSVGDTPALLQTLLATPVPSDHLLRPAALQGIEELRAIVLKDRLRRDWLDTLLSGAERALVVVALLALGSWAAHGPVGNWLHKQYAPSVVLQPARQVAPTYAPLVHAKPTSISLPPSIARPRPVDDSNNAVMVSQEDYLAQRQTLVESHLVDVPPQPTHLLIPSIAVDARVVEVFFIDGDWQVAHYAAGYLHGTALPGDVGNVVIAGHAGFFGGVFANLGGLAARDDIYIDAAGWRYHYRVRGSTVVSPTQTEVILATYTPTLTLITCTNWDLQRLVVIADLIGARPL